jgi:hypothetical protein
MNISLLFGFSVTVITFTSISQTTQNLIVSSLYGTQVHSAYFFISHSISLIFDFTPAIAEFIQFSDKS